jgi:DNA polymerase III delta prime subunit
MPSFTQVHDIVAANYRNERTRQRAVLLKGPPGCGKTALGMSLADTLGIPRDNVHVTSPPRRNPIHYMGLPDVAGDQMVWKEPEELQVLGQGKHVFIIDEVGQCTPIMQNTVSSMALERRINKMTFSPDVLVIMTSNNAEDRAGSKSILTHTGNRAMILQMEYTKDDFIPYGIDRDLDPLGLAFLEFRPQHMYDFDPAREINATPRSWEYALSLDPNERPAIYHASLRGILPDGVASEYIGFREVAERMPDPEKVRKYPREAEIPSEGDVMYALISNLIVSTETGADFENLMQYVVRCRDDFQSVYVAHVVRRVKECAQTPAYTRWLADNHVNFGGS